MDAEQFADLVALMRQAQIRRLGAATSERTHEAARLERLVDRYIRDRAAGETQKGLFPGGNAYDG